MTKLSFFFFFFFSVGEVTSAQGSYKKTFYFADSGVPLAMTVTVESCTPHTQSTNYRLIFSFKHRKRKFAHCLCVAL